MATKTFRARYTTNIYYHGSEVPISEKFLAEDVSKAFTIAWTKAQKEHLTLAGVDEV